MSPPGKAGRVVSIGDAGDIGLLLLEVESVLMRLDDERDLTPTSLSKEVIDRLRVDGRPRTLIDFSTTEESGASSLNELERELDRDEVLDSTDFSSAAIADNFGEKSGVTGGVAQCKAIR